MAPPANKLSKSTHHLNGTQESKTDEFGRNGGIHNNNNGSGDGNYSNSAADSFQASLNTNQTSGEANKRHLSDESADIPSL